MTRPQALRPAEGASEAAPGRPPIARATVTNSTTSSLRLWTMYRAYAYGLCIMCEGGGEGALRQHEPPGPVAVARGHYAPSAKLNPAK